MSYFIKKYIFISGIAFLLLIIFLACNPVSEKNEQPVNPNASPEAKALLKFLDGNQ